MKFSIRDLLWFTVVVALVLALFVERRTFKERNDALLNENDELTWRTEALVEAVGTLGYDATFDNWYGLNVIARDTKARRVFLPTKIVDPPKPSRLFFSRPKPKP